MPVKDTIVIENGEDREYSDDGIDPEENSDKSNGRERGSWLRRHVPIVRWLPGYSKFHAVSDLIAGITIGLTMIPQSIAYASLAGLTAQVALGQSSLLLSFYNKQKLSTNQIKLKLHLLNYMISCREN